jgi:organic radical activating enzyme
MIDNKSTNHNMETMSKQELIKKLKADSLPVIIYGAGATGQVLYHACIESGIEVECFCDDNIIKDETYLYETEIIHLSKIKKHYPDANWLISAADIHDIKDHLLHEGYLLMRLHSAVHILMDYNYNNFGKFIGYNDNDVDSGFVEFAVNCTIQCQQGYENPEKVFMRSVDIVVTEKCSMKCVDCSNLMQFFEKPINYTLDEMTEAVELLLYCSDEIHEFRVIGGEPLMNKQVYSLIDVLNKSSKVKRIALYTNGTIVPKIHQLESLKHEKVIFMITDYSECGDGDVDDYTARLNRFKTTTDSLEDLCKENGIDYRRHPPENWTDCGKIEKYNRSVEENKEVFRTCCCKNLITLSKNELHRCPFSAQITRLDVCDVENDYIDLNENFNNIEMKKKLRSFLYEKEYLEACGFCPGRKLSDPQIKPALQTKKPIKYERYIDQPD